jgi:hypothetical protein
MAHDNRTDVICPLEGLRLIGRQLDRDDYPDVWDGGFVSPGGQAVPSIPLGEVQQDEERRARERGPTAGSWTWPAGWAWSTGGSGPETTPASSVVRGGLAERYEAQLEEVGLAYPSLRVQREPGGLWLATTAGLLDQWPYRARFLTAVPYRDAFPKAWAIWEDGSWIGPRHTNAPDGSLCAFDINDGTWKPGQSLVGLLDLFTTWAIRHLHLKLFGTWPGKQVARDISERLYEMTDSELCGCGSLSRYSGCCKSHDEKIDKLAAAVSFQLRFGNRRPPDDVIAFLRDGRSMLPSMDKLGFSTPDDVVTLLGAMRPALFAVPATPRR